MKEKASFIEFVGDVWLRGKAVAAYQEGHGQIRLQAETCGGKRISLPKHVTAAEFSALKEGWRAGVFHQDARIAERALRFMGVVDGGDEAE